MRIECGNSHSMCINVFDELIVFGDNSLNQLGLTECRKTYPVKLSISNVIDISFGGDHTFIKTVQNGILGFGCKGRAHLNLSWFPSTSLRVLKNQEDVWVSDVTSIQSNIKSARSTIF